MAMKTLKVAVRGDTAKLKTFDGAYGTIAVDTLTGALVAGTGAAGGARMALEKDAIVGLSLSGNTLTVTRGNGVASGLTLPSGTAGGSTVSVSQTLTSGTQIASITIDGMVTRLYAPAASGGTTYNEATTTTAGLMSASDKSKLNGIQTGATAVSVARSVTSGTKIATITVNGTANDLYAPTATAGTTYTAGAGISINNNAIALATAGVSSGSYGPNANASPAAGGSFIVPQVTVDTYGRVTSASSRTITLPSASSVTVSTSLTSGTKIATITVSGNGYDLYAPAASTATATSSAAGLMSASDKSKLDGIRASATAVSFTRSLTSGTKVGTITINGTGTDIYAPAAASTSNFVTTDTDQTISAFKTYTASPCGVMVKSGAAAIALINTKGVSSSTSLTRDWELVCGSSDYNGTSTARAGQNGGFHVYTTQAGNASTLIYCTKPGSSSGRDGEHAGWQAGWFSNGSNVSGIFINSNTGGAVRASVSNVTSLGATGLLWTQVYANNSTISTSDERKKDDIVVVPDEVLDAWGKVSFYQYVFKEKKAVEGDAARKHFGVIAQRVRDVFAEAGVNAAEYSLYCYEKWDDALPTDAEYPRKADEFYAIRYVEALCLEAAYQRRRADRMEARLAALEAKVNATQAPVDDEL